MGVVNQDINTKYAFTISEVVQKLFCELWPVLGLVGITNVLKTCVLAFYVVISFAIISACFKTVSVANICISGG